MRLSLVACALTLVLCSSAPSVAAAAAASSAAEAAAAEQPPEFPDFGPDVFDPYEGIDPNGRVPKIEKPADLVHPDRWRYIPEGRIPPGNVIDRFLVTSFIIPFVFRDGDVGTGGGIGLTDIDFRGQRRREFAGIFLSYTSKGQQSYYGLWRRWIHTLDLPEGGVLQEERSFVGLSGGYRKSLTRRFFGFGPDSDEDDEVKYTDELFELELEFTAAVPDPGANLVVSAALKGEFHDLSADCKELLDGAARRAQCGPSFDESAAFQQLIEDNDHEQLGWLIAGVRWDTRDSTRNPYSGWYAGMTLEAALLQDEGDVGVLHEIETGTAFRVPAIFHDGGDDGEENPPTDTVAFGFQTRFKGGDLPFTALPALGGSFTLRGFIDGRFRDDASWHASVEHRFWVIPRGFPVTRSIRVERVGLAPFFELGSVGSNVPDLFKSEVKLSYGIGLRALLERSAPFRIDFGFSEDGYNITARFGYSF